MSGIYQHVARTMRRMVFVLGVLATPIAAQNMQDNLAHWNALNRITITEFRENRIEDAAKSARAALAFAQANLPADARELSSSYNNLGTMLHRLGEYSAARAAHLDALRIREAQVPADQNEIATSLISVADSYYAQNAYGEAADFFGRAAHLLQSMGVDHQYVLSGLAYALYLQENRTEAVTRDAFNAMQALATSYGNTGTAQAGAYDAALENTLTLARALDLMAGQGSIAQTLIELRAAADPYDENAHAWAFRYLAEIHVANRAHTEAEDAMNRAITLASRAAGGMTQDAATLNYILGDLLSDIGRFEQAEQAFRTTLAIERSLYGDAHPETINSYNRLGLLLVNTERSAAAVGVLRRGLMLAVQVHGADSLWVATLSDNLGLALSDAGNVAEAIPMHRDALRIREAELGRMDPSTSKTVNNLALALEKDGQFESAQAYFREALEIDRATLPAGSWEIGVALTNLASSLSAMQTLTGSAEAYLLLREALEVSRQNYPATHPDVAASLDNLAVLARRAALHDDATRYLREATQIYAAPQNRAALADRHVVFDAAVASLLTRAPARYGAEAFELAQWPMQTAASKAIAASAQRTAGDDPALARLIRQLQDAQRSHSDVNNRVLAALGSEDETLRADLQRELAQTQQQLARLQDTLARDFPDFTQLQAGVPVSVAEVAQVLAPDEALVFIRPGHTRVEGDEMEGAIFVVRADGTITAGPLERSRALEDDAQSLLCSVQAGVAGCPEASAASGLSRGAFDLDAAQDAGLSQQAFNFDLAHNLYTRIFGPVAAELRDVERLIIVPGGETLAALPFQLLISEPVPERLNTEAEAYRAARWLIRDWSLTALPNVSSLTHARGQEGARAQAGGGKAFLGIGDPVIGAASTIECGQAPALQLAALDRAVATTQTAQLWNAARAAGGSAIADVDAVRRLTRLPDTRCELEQISASLGGGDILLAQEATETEVKSLSATGALRTYDVISFATHGLVAGEIANAEPALVLTPPARGTAQDDGLLSATEISQLDLNAEWVLLSACNTAAGRVRAGDGSHRRESFSGLARAFFYAGARNLLVSHWPVQSPAAVSLTTATFDAMAQDATLDRSAAFQRAMLRILDDPNSTAPMLHPRYWAPFTLLGNSP